MGLTVGYLFFNDYNREEKTMSKIKYMKGSQLFALARKKAGALAMDSNGLKLEELIKQIQEVEGHEACFRLQPQCSEKSCCWQASCSAEMKG
ncbi:MAG: hypothetical protein ABFS19_11090 [Thermodesulfobacteriota bacterium]